MGKREEAHKILSEQLSKFNYNKVIEIGCNNFKRRIPLPLMGLDVDIKHKPKIVSDIEYGMPFKNSSIDAVVGIDIVEHVSDIQNFLSECIRIIRKNGIMSFIIPRADVFGYEVKNIKKYGHKNMWTKTDWDNLIKKTNIFPNFPLKTLRLENLPGDWFFLFTGERMRS